MTGAYEKAVFTDADGDKFAVNSYIDEDGSVYAEIFPVYHGKFPITFSTDNTKELRKFIAALLNTLETIENAPITD